MNEKLWPVLGLLLLPFVSAHGQEGDISFKSTELAPGLYMLEGQGGFAGGNLGLSTGDDGVVLIDDGVAPLAPKLLAAIEDIAGRPADFVINTHLHGDHTGGNAALHETGATIIGHENIRRRMLESDDASADGSAPAPKEAMPEITFSRSMTFHLNGHEAFVFHVASAHTDGDAVISFRGVDVIHAGDIFFNGVFPFIDLDSGGSVSGLLEAQDDILSLAGPDTRIIPGHGPLASKADLQAARDMLADARERVKKLVDAGNSEQEILDANPLAAYDDWDWSFITTEVMIRTLIRDLREAG
ncbi:MAG TPA: MBL fold metallo-hydrolase [Woeseiaceae bacterium]|nr:MBL fold metallo-hydrolase [Woeseiaceae bacterium]